MSAIANDSEMWGNIRPRRRLNWRLARVVAVPDGGAAWAGAYLTLDYVDGGQTRLRLGQLARPMPQLAAALARTRSARELAAYMLEVALHLRNTGIPIAVRPGDERATRPKTLFAAFDEQHGSVRVRPVHTIDWLTGHVAKHLVRAEAEQWAEAIRGSRLALPVAEIKGLARRWRGDVLQPAAWPLIEVYSLLLAEALARPGPTQLEARLLDVGDQALEQELALEAATTTFERSTEMIRARTLPGLEAIAKGSGQGPMNWATLHPRAPHKFQRMLERSQQSAAVDVGWVV